ncbi:MAG: 4-(cytidine 5'-diphospho)-2-C-methyl-D-erythritol kinase [Planctomycetes bacterium]|nr:4-(cytidine 5'-diphospho)-2-C-methyl-D-erythritol kinase [Planctomycetota bacterium]
MRVIAPAKLNLYLEVLGKRPDGYHDLHTVMHEIDLCDTIRIERRKRVISLKCTGLFAPDGPENLAWQAAGIFLKETQIRGGVRIELTKRIPAQRGLGGGSSDAAAVLRGMNALYGTGLSDRKLMTLAARLGSDVPFFIKGGTALCEGRGERVRPIRTGGRFHFVLVLPPFGLSTARVYKELTRKDLTPKSAGAKILLTAVKGGDTESLGLGAYNRLEGPAFRLRPRLRRIKKEMAALGCRGPLMSGSGSAVFCVAPDMATAECLAESIHCKRLGRSIAVRTFHRIDRT